MTGEERELAARLQPPDPSSTSSRHPPNTAGSGSPRWSSRAAKMTYKEMSLTLQQVGDVVPTPLTRKEVLQLLVQKLNIPPANLL